MAFQRIIVAVGSRGVDQRVLPMAARVARQVGAPLELLSVIVAGTGDRELERLELLQQGAAAGGLDDPDITVLEGFRAARTVAEYVGEQPGALLCLATSTRSRADQLLFGSTATEIVQRSRFPVLVAGPSTGEDADPFSGPVVITVDGSTSSESVLPLARDWCAASGQTPWVISQLDAELAVDRELESAGVHRAAEKVGPGTEWEVLHGRDPGAAIADFADQRDAGLIVMATHGRSGLASVAFGSVAMRTVQQAACPVLIQRPPELEPPADDE